MCMESAELPAPDTDKAFGAIHGDWVNAAECKGNEALFFSPGKEANALRVSREERARNICLRCPVIDVCLANALDAQETTGIWGGTTPAERRTARSKALAVLKRTCEEGQKPAQDEVNRRAFNLLYDQRPDTTTGQH